MLKPESSQTLLWLFLSDLWQVASVIVPSASEHHVRLWGCVSAPGLSPLPLPVPTSSVSSAVSLIFPFTLGWSRQLLTLSLNLLWSPACSMGRLVSCVWSFYVFLFTLCSTFCCVVIIILLSSETKCKLWIWKYSSSPALRTVLTTNNHWLI